jgi:hypothetical protein
VNVLPLVARFAVTCRRRDPVHRRVGRGGVLLDETDVNHARIVANL